jgi:hypothetical protein
VYINIEDEYQYDVVMQTTTSSFSRSNMQRNKRGSMVHVVFLALLLFASTVQCKCVTILYLLFFFYFTSCNKLIPTLMMKLKKNEASGRLHLLEFGTERSLVNKNTTATTVDESKRNVVLAPCVKRMCGDIAPTPCHCCTLDNPNKCFWGMDNCMSQCPSGQ